MRRVWIAPACLAAALAVGFGHLQPTGAPAENPAPETEEREALRARLEHAVERAERTLARQREALERLEAGESPGEIMRSLRARPARTPDGPVAADDRPRGPGVGAPPGAEAAVTPEARRRLRAFVRDHLPSLHEQLETIEAQDADMGARLLDRMAPQLDEVATEMDHDPPLGYLKLAELRAGLAVVDATHRLRALPADADASRRAEAERELRTAIAARFDARIRLREQELERLAARISELHEQIKAERAERDDEIERVFRSVIAQRWAGPTPPGRANTRGD